MKKSALRHIIREALLRNLNEAPKPEEQAPQQPIAQTKDPAAQAHELNLVYDGWGTWNDQSGKPVAKTIDGKLVRISEPQAAAPGPQKTQTPIQDPYENPTPVSSGKPIKVNKKGFDTTAAPDLTQYISDTPAGEPGSIEPPLTSTGDPIEVTVNGEPGLLDKVTHDDQFTTWVSLDSGRFYVGPAKHVKLPKEQFKKAAAAPKPSATPAPTAPKAVEKPAQTPQDDTIDPKVDKEMHKVFKEAGRHPYNPIGQHHVSPGWNTGMDTNDIPFDANAEQTVAKLLAMIGDPMKLIAWLVRKFREETPNGKQRILQYLGVLKSMGIGDGEARTNPEEPENFDGPNHFGPDQ